MTATVLVVDDEKDLGGPSVRLGAGRCDFGIGRRRYGRSQGHRGGQHHRAEPLNGRHSALLVMHVVDCSVPRAGLILSIARRCIPASRPWLDERLPADGKRQNRPHPRSRSGGHGVERSQQNKQAFRLDIIISNVVPIISVLHPDFRVPWLRLGAVYRKHFRRDAALPRGASARYDSTGPLHSPSMRDQIASRTSMS